MKSEHVRWLDAVCAVTSEWHTAKIMTTETEPNRMSRAEALRRAGALIIQLERLAGLSIIGPDGRSISMRLRIENLMKYARSLYSGSVDPVPIGASRIIDLGGPLTGGAAAMGDINETSLSDGDV